MISEPAARDWRKVSSARMRLDPEDARERASW